MTVKTLDQILTEEGCLMYTPPKGTELIESSEPFVARDGDRWFVMQNHDYEDRDGNPGMSTEYLCDPHGYATQSEANAALQSLTPAAFALGGGGVVEAIVEQRSLDMSRAAIAQRAAINARHPLEGLSARMQLVAPGFYTERDGGDWYAVSSDRIGEGFRNRDDARRFVCWLAGDEMPKGWTLERCGSGELFYALIIPDRGSATVWARTCRKLFPGRAAELAEARS